MNKNTISPVVAGIAGAAIGAVAGAVLANDEMRENVKEKGEVTLHQIRKAAKKTNGKKS